LGGLWALELAWHSAETNMRSAEMSGICMPNPSIVACISRDLSVHTDRRTWLVRWTRLVILIKIIYTLGVGNVSFTALQTSPVGNGSFCLLHTFRPASDPDQEYIYFMGG